MNIFYIETDPSDCAKSMYNTHVVKMILEYSQILSTAHRVILGESADDRLYKMTHKNHPSTIWARANCDNYLWLANLLKETALEYTHRYEKIHLTERKGIIDLLQTPPPTLEAGEFFEPPQCMPDYCKSNKSLDAYRKLYMTEKLPLMAYKNRQIPNWLTVVNPQP